MPRDRYLQNGLCLTGNADITPYKAKREISGKMLNSLKLLLEPTSGLEPLTC
jgi:hypothetical protein